MRQPYQNRKSDIVFLLQTSSAVTSASELQEEKRFVTKLLDEIAVSFEATRVQVIPFGSRAHNYIDFVSQPATSKNKCEFRTRFSTLPREEGISMIMSAFREAWGVCFGSKSANKRNTRSIKTVIILLSNGDWKFPDLIPINPTEPRPIDNPFQEAETHISAGGPAKPVRLNRHLHELIDPRPTAKQLRDAGVDIFAVGLGSINVNNLLGLVDNPAKVFRLAGFSRFAELAAHIRGGEPALSSFIFSLNSAYLGRYSFDFDDLRNGSI